MRLGIVGIGMIGGSLAAGLSQVDKSITLLGYDQDIETRTQARDSGFFSQVDDTLAVMIPKCDGIVLCTPLSTYGEIAQLCDKYLPKTAFVTDVGSVKAEPLKLFMQNAATITSDRIIPAHPIAGKSLPGFSHADAKLFQGKKVILTPFLQTPPESVKQVSQIWESLGAAIETMDMNEHDLIYARVSHLVQLCLYAYCQALVIENTKIPGDRQWQRFIRIGGSPSMMWVDIVLANGHYLEEELEVFSQMLAMIYEKAVKQRHGTDAENARSDAEMLAFLIAEGLYSYVSNEMRPYAGTGFSDVTAYAAPQMVTSTVLPLLEEYVETLTRYKSYLISKARNELAACFEEARQEQQRQLA